MKIKNKVGYCSNKILNLRDRQGKILPGGHYVYIREDNKNGTCNVNIITSLEKNGKYELNKINKIKNGYLYAIPKKDSNFSQWSAINLSGNIKNIKINNIQDIGKKKIPRRHLWYVGKFSK